MKQIFQNIANGVIQMEEGPDPQVRDNSLIISTNISLISSGTERMLVNFGKANYIGKIKQQPEKVKKVIEKVYTDGFYSTLGAVKSKLAKPFSLGYCNVGVVNNIGKNVKGFKIGDRVVSNGPHADVVQVSQNLCALLPDNVDDETASFVTLSSIGLQGIRLAKPTLGESFAVIGTGLIGLLTVQLLIANGCRVLAIDQDEKKLDLAVKFGASKYNTQKGEDAVSAGMSFSNGQGVDGVIITASTKSNNLISQAAAMSRKRGRIILIGVTGLDLNRSDFYEKELKFQVSCSFGPGRYDQYYEEKNIDYPLPYVRWTEQRNFEAVIDMLSRNLLDTKSLISHKYKFSDYSKAYQTLSSDRNSLGIILTYAKNKNNRLSKEIILNSEINFKKDKPIISFIGAGNYGSRVLIPAFKASGAQFHTILTESGISSAIQGKRGGFLKASSDNSQIFNNPEINTVVVATRHDSHAQYVIKALDTKKHIFVEKPLTINLEQLEKIERKYNHSSSQKKKFQLMVGFNRRFSPQIQKMKVLINPINEKKSIIITVNAGFIPKEHWTQDVTIGGGRIIGEACHFIDLMRYLIDEKINSIKAYCLGKSSDNPTDDTATITLGFEDGSIGTIHYFSNGAPSFPKERVEIFVDGKILLLDNFRKLKGFGWKNFKNFNLWKQDKGQSNCVEAFINAIEKGVPAIPVNEIFEVTRVSIKVSDILRNQ